MPMRGLHEFVSRPPAYTRLLQMCRGGRPTTHADPAFPAASCSEAESQAATLDTPPPTFLVVPALEFVGASSPDDPRIRDLLQEASNKRRAADLVVAGALQAFHAACFPEGHRQTNLDRWTKLPLDATPYEVKTNQTTRCSVPVVVLLSSGAFAKTAHHRCVIELQHTFSVTAFLFHR